MWEVYSEGRVPYDNRSNAEVVEALNARLRLLRPRVCPQSVYELMQWSWKEVSTPQTALKLPSIANDLNKLSLKYLNINKI